MSNLSELAKRLAPSDPATPVRQPTPLGRTSGIVSAINSDNSLMVEPSGTSVAIPAITIGPCPASVGDTVELLTTGTMAIVLGVRNGGNPYAIATCSSVAVANGAVAVVPVASFAASNYGNWTLNSSGEIVLPVAGLYSVTGVVAGTGFPDVGYGFFAELLHNGSPFLGTATVSAHMSGLSVFAAGDTAGLQVSNSTGNSITTAATTTQLHLAYLGPK